jgi:small subunit ribosomal protein S9
VTDTEPALNVPPASPEAPAVPQPPADIPPTDAVVESSPVATAPAPEAAPTLEGAPPGAANVIYWGTGRRKCSVARVRFVPGGGKIVINQRALENYFTEPQDRLDAVAPLELTGVRKQWDVFVNVRGGGHSGQAGAVRLGMARALLKAYNQHEAALRDSGYLTRDARIVERKKYGRRKARRRFQFSKR